MFDPETKVPACPGVEVGRRAPGQFSGTGLLEFEKFDSRARGQFHRLTIPVIGGQFHSSRFNGSSLKVARGGQSRKHRPPLNGARGRAAWCRTEQVTDTCVRRSTGILACSGRYWRHLPIRAMGARTPVERRE